MKKKRSATHSVKWNAINSLVSQGTTIITGVILMRLLDPSAFGLIGMITVFTGFLNKLKDSGLASSLIYEKNITKTDRDTVFWFNMVMGLLLFVLFYLSSSYIAQYYNEPILNKLVKVFSFTFIISALSNIQFTLLKKQLDFKKTFQIQITGLLVSTVLTIIAAYMGFGVWSLIVLHISSSLINCICVYIVAEYKPSTNFSYEILKKHFRYSFPVLGTQSFNYWTRNADNFFIGSLLGSQALGYYSRAYFFVTMPTQKISNVLGGVLFPSLSLLKDDKRKAADLFLKAMKMTAFITFPLIGGLIIFTEPFVLTVFGEHWIPMISSLQILSVLSFFQSVFVYSAYVYYSQGATKLNFNISVLYGICNIIVFYIGSLYSIEMVAILLLTVYLLFLFPKLYYTAKLIDIKIIDVLKNLKSIFLINLFCMVISFVTYIVFLLELASMISLVLGVLLYFTLFVVSNYFFNKIDSIKFINNILNIIKAK